MTTSSSLSACTVALALLLSACSATPPYRQPEMPVPAAF